jgi:hypothetical protein
MKVGIRGVLGVCLKGQAMPFYLQVNGSCMPDGMRLFGRRSMAPKARLPWKTGMAPF